MEALIYERLELRLARIARPPLHNFAAVGCIIIIIAISGNFLLRFRFLHAVAWRSFEIRERMRSGMEEAAGIEELRRDLKYRTLSLRLLRRLVLLPRKRFRRLIGGVGGGGFAIHGCQSISVIEQLKGGILCETLSLRILFRYLFVERTDYLYLSLQTPSFGNSAIKPHFPLSPPLLFFYFFII